MASYQKVNTSEEVNGHATNVGDMEKSKPQNKLLLLGGCVIALMLGFTMLHKTVPVGPATMSDGTENSSPTETRTYFDDRGRFLLEDYDTKPSFADFLPAIAGLYGKPVWCFYVNRGQGVSSFGTVSKDYPIMEFNAANKAYYMTPFVGFRTFIQATRSKRDFFVEPFSPFSRQTKRIMYVGTNEMEVKEIDELNGLETSAVYFVLPNEDFSSLVRRTTIENIGDDEVTFSFLDGLAKMEPAGGRLDGMLKNMGRTLEGWMGVYQAKEDSITMPFYRLSTEPSDTASVTVEKSGHYCLAFLDSEDSESELLPIMYDPNKIFGEADSSLAIPAGVMSKSVSELINGPQYGDAITSSGFAAVEDITLAPGESVTVNIFYGKADHVYEVPEIAKVITAPNYVPNKLSEARELVDVLLAGVETNTSNPLFNGLVKQTFLDNSLRGGLPIIIGDVDDEMKLLNADEDPRVKVFHVFSRIHGDLERDYNAFEIVDTYYSQGPGNYRDVAQNRRNDVFFAPRMASFNILMFLEFIQADAYEPLTVEAVAYMVYDSTKAKKVSDEVCADEKSSKILQDVLAGGPFRPGQLFNLVEQLKIKVKVENDVFINTIVSVAKQTSIALYGTGYWGDHWDYYLDLINPYLAIYPEGEESLMYDNQIKFFFSTATVQPRSEKYVVTLTFDGTSNHILQLDATFFDQSKVVQQSAFINRKTGRKSLDANWQQDPDDNAVTCTPIAKLFLLATIKFATRDAYGMGIEYEGGRPGWNDAMNGLPGMVGSAMPETYELYQLLKYVHKVVKKYKRPLEVPEEFFKLVTKIQAALDDLDYTDPEVLPYDVPQELFDYWDTVATAREKYREETRYYFTGVFTSIKATSVIEMLEVWIDQVQLGMNRAMLIGSHGFEDDGTSGVPPCYFSYDITEWKENGKYSSKGLPHADALKMRVGRFPLFLEGPVRMMKTIDDESDIRDLYHKVKQSGLRDHELKMYFISADLQGQSYDMGRMMAFSSGWLENHSIWTHMSYKYYLEIIRAEMYEEFFDEMTGGGMLPYMDPDKYGRSTMQFSSFLASSAFPDPATHGRGFSARLSGSTAEFLSIWILMFIGPEPFSLDSNDKLQFTLKPALPIFLFNEIDNEYTIQFKLFASIVVTYHNSLGTNLYGISPNQYIITYTDGNVVEVDDQFVPAHVADDIRRVMNVDSIDAYF